MHFFTNDKVGMVQVRWDHVNRDYSRLTELQAMMLDGHFVIEHTARHRSGRFFNFNGTAGIWRRSAIADAGGWSHDTLTEDMDLSYRAQLTRLGVHLSEGRGLAGRAAGRDERVQVAAVPLGQGLDPGGEEAAADDLAQQGRAVQRQARGVLPPDEQLRLSAACCCCRSCSCRTCSCARATACARCC